MTKLAISELSQEARKALLEEITSAFPGKNHSAMILELLEVMDTLMQKLSSKNVTIEQLRELFGIELQKLKKEQEKR